MNTKWRWLVCLCLGCFLLTAGSEKPKAFLHCYVQLFPHPSMKKEEVIPVQLQNPRSMIFVSITPDLSEADMAKIEPLPEGKTLILFNEFGTRKLAALTQANMESILVIVCNGRVVYTPLIDTVISNGRLLIPDGIAPAEVEELNGLIRAAHPLPPTQNVMATPTEQPALPLHTIRRPDPKGR